MAKQADNSVGPTRAHSLDQYVYKLHSPIDLLRLILRQQQQINFKLTQAQLI